MRLLRTGLVLDDVEGKVRDIVNAFFRKVPSGVGSEGAVRRLSESDLRQVAVKGARWAIEQGYGDAEHLDHIEEGGVLPGADPDLVSEVAFKRGARQVGTLGSGNHFLEIQYVDEVYRPEIADALGLAPRGIVVSIHTGSRGFGYQVCDDYLKKLSKATRKYGIWLPDPQLRCAPLGTPEASEYLGAMSAAANYAFVNRQTITHLATQALLESLSISPRQLDLGVVYDVCHNIGKYEDHDVDGKTRRLFVHRKGATRAFAPGHPLTPERYRDVGQPVLIPGDMGRYSYVLVGTETAMKETFGSSCHGAGRVMSRRKASEKSRGRNLFKEMEERGVVVVSRSHKTLGEEMPYAYKDVAEVVDPMEGAGLSLKVARLKPIGCTKG